MAGRSPGVGQRPEPDATTADRPADLAPGAGPAPLAALGRFTVGPEIGRGGMGQVLSARDPVLDREVAIKVIAARGRDSELARARFLTEAHITARLDHPGIVPVHELGRDEAGLPFLVMKRVAGSSLGAVLRRIRDGDPETASWTRFRLLSAFVQATQAVAYAHSRRVLHRDLKPDNVMLGEYGEVYVMDWGVARLLGPGGDAAELVVAGEPVVVETVHGSAVGTPGYMSPEQASAGDRAVDERSDVWSLGAILYEIVCLDPAYRGTAIERIRLTLAGPPPDPRVRAAGQRVPGELAEIAMKALATEPEARHRGAAELGAAVQGFLEGSRRREAAARRLAEGRAPVGRLDELERLEDRLAESLQGLAGSVAPWAPIDDRRKAELLAVEDRLEAVREERAVCFSRAIAAAEGALSHDADHGEAHRLLADLYWARFERAERRRDPIEEGFFRDRVLEHDPDRYGPLLVRPGVVTLATDPPGAEVRCRRFTQRGLVWPLDEGRSLGATPLVRVPLEAGSYLLELRAPGRRDTVYPLVVARGGEHDAGPDPIPLLSDEAIGPGWRYVPKGPFRCGGDPAAGLQLPEGERTLEGFLIAELPVTVGEYFEFLTGLHRDDPDAAWERAPRFQESVGTGSRYVARPAPGEPYRVPERDLHDDPWHPRYPAFSVSWHDAVAYAAWRARRDGLPVRLVADTEWEKAARGADGRLFPWGDRFDASLCKMGTSRPGRPQPEPVGSFAGDVSVYGVRDVAGSIREWCGDAAFDGDPSRRPIRGGAWSQMLKMSRLANRFGMEPNTTAGFLGFRLARDIPSAAPGPQHTDPRNDRR